MHAVAKKDNERIVAAVAYSRLRERLIAQEEEFAGLSWEDIELLHHRGDKAARLFAGDDANFQVPHEAITKLIAKAPKLERLLTLSAEVAVKAGKVDGALAYLDWTQKFLSEKLNEMDRARPDDENDKIGQKAFQRLRGEFIRKFNSQAVQRPRIISSCALPLADGIVQETPPKPSSSMCSLRIRHFLG